MQEFQRIECLQIAAAIIAPAIKLQAGICTKKENERFYIEEKFYFEYKAMPAYDKKTATG